MSMTNREKAKHIDAFKYWCEMYIPVPDISKTIKMLEIEKQCVLRQDTPQCTRECSFCDLVQNADEVISAYDTAINLLKQITGKSQAN